MIQVFYNDNFGFFSFILKYLILLLDKGTLCVHSNAVQALAGGTITALKTWTTLTAMGK